MKTPHVLWMGVLVGSLLAGRGATAQTKADSRDPSADAAPQPLCPVSDEPANLAVSIATAEGPVFFCSADCIPTYRKEPAQFAEKLKTQRAALAQRPKVQVACPVTAKPVNRDVSFEYKGETIHFCCPDCIEPFKADPGKYAVQLANSYTYQVTCPVMGHEIDPTSFTELADGRRIYYCCDGCEPKLFGKPAKYAGHLAKLGYQYNWAEIKKADKPGAEPKRDPQTPGHG